MKTNPNPTLPNPVATCAKGVLAYGEYVKALGPSESRCDADLPECPVTMEVSVWPTPHRSQGESPQGPDSLVANPWIIAGVSFKTTFPY